MHKDHPQYTIIREELCEKIAAFVPGASSAGYPGTTFRTYGKSVVIGVAVKFGAVGSGGTTKTTVAVARGDEALSARDVVNPTSALVASSQTAFLLTSPITLLSLNDCVAIHGTAPSSLDNHQIQCVVWRYRMLPTGGSTDVSDNFSHAQLG